MQNSLTTAKIIPIADASGLKITKANGTTDVLVMDTTNSYVGVNCAPVSNLTVRNGSTCLLVANSDYAAGSAGSSLRIRLGATSGDTYGDIQAIKTGGTVVTDLCLNPSGGNVGIGCTPTAALSVNGVLTVQHGNTQAYIHRGVAYGSYGLSLQGNANTTLNDTYPGALIQIGGGALDDGYEGNITLLAYGGSTSDANRNVIKFLRRTGTNTTAESMRIDGGGNVGIGIESPTAPLTFAKATGSKIHLYADVDSGIYAGFGIRDNELQIHANTGDHVSFNFGVGLQASGTNEVMRVQSNGHVGIGCTPSTKLEIAGSDAFLYSQTTNASNSGTAYHIYKVTATATTQTIIGTDRAIGAGLLTDSAANATVLASQGAHPLHLGTNNAVRMTITSGGLVGIGCTPSFILDINGDTIRLQTAKTPATSGATGSTGQICWDASYVYVAVGTNSWKRAALSSW